MRAALLLIVALGCATSTAPGDPPPPVPVPAPEPAPLASTRRVAGTLACAPRLAPPPPSTTPGPWHSSLHKDVIRGSIRRHIDEVSHCYEAGLVGNRSLGGRTMTRFAIDRSGKVASSCLESSTMNAPEVERCILDRILTWEFPPPEGGGWVVVSYPFVLTPAQ